MLPGIPKIPPVIVAVCKVAQSAAVENPLYFIEITIGAAPDIKQFRVCAVSGVGDRCDGTLELFTKEEAKAFVESELPKVIRMAGGNVIFRENAQFQVSEDILNLAIDSLPPPPKAA